MKRDKIFVIVNPVADSGIAGKRWLEVAAELKRGIGLFDYEESAVAGHARILARNAVKAGYSTIVAYGGDGTVNETVNGMFDGGGIVKKGVGAASRLLPTLGILPAGTGSDFMRSFGNHGGIPEQIKVLKGGNKKKIDVGRIKYLNKKGMNEERVFVNIADAGLGADTIRLRDRARKLVGHRLAYFAATLSSLVSWSPQEMTIEVDQEKPSTDRFLSIVIANGKFFGGGMPIAPEAELDDGFFELITARDPNFYQMLLSTPLLYARKLRQLSNIKYRKAGKVRLTSEAPVFLDIDGEDGGQLPATFEILPKSLSVMVP